MKRVATAAVLIPLVLLAVLRAPAPLLALLVGLVALLTVREFLDLVGHYGAQPSRRLTCIFVALIFVALALEGIPKPLLATGAMVFGVGFAAVAAAFVFLVAAMRNSELAASYPAAAASTFAVVYIALPLALMAQLRQQWAGAFLVLYLLIVVWVGDTAAYYVGRAIGRHKLAPRISPGKTWEGAIGSFLAAIGVGVYLFVHARAISMALLRVELIEPAQGYLAIQTPSLIVLILLPALINVAAQLGDLAESLLKRGAGVKDSGSLLPGHGGMLDRIDALLFAAPVLWYYATMHVIS
ncbi:MAG TPA: phosphatidate cytidylyltransferase [Terriglobales bacterium]|nr:phosphatidate cytidylyltransferase [Terriglobales bacterium]